MSRRCERELDKEEEEKPETSLGHPKVSRSGNGATDSVHQLRATDRITQRHGSKSPKRYASLFRFSPTPINTLCFVIVHRFRSQAIRFLKDRGQSKHN